MFLGIAKPEFLLATQWAAVKTRSSEIRVPLQVLLMAVLRMLTCVEFEKSQGSDQAGLTVKNERPKDKAACNNLILPLNTFASPNNEIAGRCPACLYLVFTTWPRQALRGTLLIFQERGVSNTLIPKILFSCDKTRSFLDPTSKKTTFSLRSIT